MYLFTISFADKISDYIFMLNKNIIVTVFAVFLTNMNVVISSDLNVTKTGGNFNII